MLAKLNFKTIGNGENIVMLHGFAIHSGVWQNIADQLSQSYRVTLIDLPNKQAFSLEDITTQILAAAPSKTIWMGWSMGGLIAMWIAIHYPETAKKIILVNSSPCFMKKPNWPGIKPKTLAAFKESLKKDLHHTILRFLNLQLNADSHERRNHLRHLKTILLAKNLPTIEALISELDLLYTTDLRARLLDIKCPALFILGNADVLVPAAIEKFLRIYIPKAQIKSISQAAHVPFISHAQVFLEIVRNFLHAK
jgi:pimeloyl-[acyl-carrier protein] methyl ester esterase